MITAIPVPNSRHIMIVGITAPTITVLELDEESATPELLSIPVNQKCTLYVNRELSKS